SPAEPKDQRVLDVAVAGLPNAGKSTLLNLMVGEKVSAVSHKRHTTRTSTLGVVTVGKTQISFFDTPGFVSYQDQEEYIPDLFAAAREAIDEVDITLVVVDAAKRLDDKGRLSLSALLDRSFRSSRQPALVLNKIDLVNPKDRLLYKTEEILGLMRDASDRVQQTEDEFLHRGASGGRGGEENEQLCPQNRGDRTSNGGFNVPVFMLSALGGSGVKDLADYLLRQARPGGWIFGEEERTNLNTGQRVEEIVRESLYHYLHREVPYQLKQRTSQLRLNRDNTLSAEHEIRVERASQRFIVLGQINNIKKHVEKDLTKLFNKPTRVHFNICGGS
ncbi:unnamed protein product, partial [Discosporangium mesarthrocarpum]